MTTFRSDTAPASTSSSEIADHWRCLNHWAPYLHLHCLRALVRYILDSTSTHPIAYHFIKMSKALKLSLLLFSSANAARSCDVDTLTSLLHGCNLPGPSKVVYAQHIAQGGASFDTSPPFPNNATDLPELCAVKVNVQSSDSSAYNFGLFLPSEWKQSHDDNR